MAREINLVPDIKGEMIRAIKIRNLTFFVSIVAAAASLTIILIFGVIAGGQQAVVDGKKNTIDNLSAKLNQYNDLDEFLTFKDQLSNLALISSNKKLLSRTFSILPAIFPTGADTIKISELNVDLSGQQPTISFDAQADAGEPPYIDYRVLLAFEKSMQYLRYDYGNYVDKNGKTIPAYCMIEAGSDGATFYDQSTSSYYALWLITGDGCNPSYQSSDRDDSSNTQLSAAELQQLTNGYDTEDYNGQTVVRIWRTPQFSKWYQSSPTEGEPSITLSGNISNVAHFESRCIVYTGHNSKEYASNESESVITTVNGITWTSRNDSCVLVPNNGSKAGIDVTSSSNGRGADGSLVLRFSATITLAPEVYSFNNHHVLAFGPSGRYNVTDSYVQIQSLFEKRADDCSENDSACQDANNAGKGEN